MNSLTLAKYLNTQHLKIKHLVEHLTCAPDPLPELVNVGRINGLNLRQNLFCYEIDYPLAVKIIEQVSPLHAEFIIQRVRKEFFNEVS